MTDTLAVYTTSGKSSIEELTPMLRWNEGVLEQGFSVTTYESGKPMQRSIEWRPVPTARERT